MTEEGIFYARSGFAPPWATSTRRERPEGSLHISRLRRYQGQGWSRRFTFLPTPNPGPARLRVFSISWESHVT